MRSKLDVPLGETKPPLEVRADGHLEPAQPAPALLRAAASDLRCAANDLENNQKTNARAFIASALDKINESEIDD
jgi:hypothetical protein